MLKIQHVIPALDCGDISLDDVEQYATAIEEAFRRKYPGADVDVIVVPNQYGGGKLRVWEEAADGSELPPHECSVDVDAVRDHLAYIAERLFETAGA